MSHFTKSFSVAPDLADLYPIDGDTLSLMLTNCGMSWTISRKSLKIVVSKTCRYGTVFYCFLMVAFSRKRHSNRENFKIGNSRFHINTKTRFPFQDLSITFLYPNIDSGVTKNLSASLRLETSIRN